MMIKFGIQLAQTVQTSLNSASRRCLVVYAVILPLVLSGNNAIAGIFDTHSRLFLRGGGYVVTSPWEDVLSDDYSVTTVRVDRNFEDPYTGGQGLYASSSSASAFTNPFASDFLGAGAFANTGSSYAVAYAGWRDVAFTGSDGGPGTSIRLNFSVSAELGGLIGSRSTIGIVGGTNVGDEVWHDGNMSLGVVQFTDAGILSSDGSTVLPDPIIEFVGWDSYSVDGGEFFGTTHLEVPFDENYGGYSWQLGIQATSSGSYSSGFASSLHSVGLTSVTDLEGNMLSGVTFDSGLASVPEPSSAEIIGVCMFMMILVRLRPQYRAGIRAIQNIAGRINSFKVPRRLTSQKLLVVKAR